MKTTKTDPMIREMKAALRASCIGQLDALLAEERRWKSKETLASNKLRAVRQRINEFSRAAAKELHDFRARQIPCGPGGTP